MQVSVESTGALKREMKVTIPEEKIAGEINNRLENMSKTTKIDGFRKGKVPMKVLEQRYGQQVRQEVLGEVVQNSYYEALQQEKLTPAGSPQINPEDNEGNGLIYTAVFEVMPEITLGSVDDLEIEKSECDISDEDYEKMVETLKSQRTNLEEVDRESKTGDTVEINFDGYIDDEPFEGGSAKDFKLELGQNRFIEGFEDGLTGKKTGDKVSLDLKFPDEYQQESVAGKPVRFEVEINKILEPVLPELNDEFFEQFGVKEGGEEAFKKEVLSHMEKEAQSAQRNKLRDAVMTKLYEANPVDLPEALIHEEIHRLEHQYLERLRSYGIDPATQKDAAPNHDMFKDQANKRVALQLIVMEIIKDQEFKADPVKVREIIEKNAANYEDPEVVKNWYYQEKQRLSEIEAVVLEDQVIDWVCENAKINKVDVKFDDLMNNGQTA
ncbi:MAG: trigger factor [Gammaproteobacteria bacterium]|nr:trigger factor [Gammaproteobacteria bacterium]